MTSQQTGDAALAIWRRKDLTESERIDRIEVLMRDFFAPPPVSDLEYEMDLRAVAAEMERG